MHILIILVVLTLVAIGILHIYWVFGGSWGLDSAMPEEMRSKYFKEGNSIQSALMTLSVAIGLFIFAFIITSNCCDFSHIIAPRWSNIGTRIIGTIFMIRAIGDFNQVGLFKKKSDSQFGRSDTKIFVPICLFLGIGSLVISFF